ncbi:MAG: carboxymuconolactone decarboxylase family protein [Betaproteobacteria bacterium]|nr:carboxymuconolactone decarboxylase family protein [Betaproteobacteria bacterium]
MNGKHPGPGFRRKIYASPMEFGRNLRRVLGNFRSVIALLSKSGLSAGFRERIMVTVTGVNRCRHCAYGHEFLAQKAGVSKAEIAGLLAQDLANSPTDEIPALLFAIHWTETDGLPSAPARSDLETRYGIDSARQIEAAVLLINTGNRIGNTFDYLLSRITRGRFGLLLGER